MPALAASATPLSAMAHEGHGLEGAHWHASDGLLFLLMTAVAIGLLAWWRSRH